MASFFDALEQKHQDFIANQHIFFTATAPLEGRINLSPKGMDSLRVLGPNRILWLNLTGSGNETAAHLLEQNRITIMWCSFDKAPLILRVYGSAEAIHPRDENWQDVLAHFPDLTGARQIFDVKVDSVQTSCGYAVPRMEFVEERPTLIKYAENLGEDGLCDYWERKNVTSIDGQPTEIFG